VPVRGGLNMKALLALAMAGALIFAACGSDDDDGDTGGGATPDTGGVRPSTQAVATQPGATPACTASADPSDGNASGIPPLEGELSELTAASPYDNCPVTMTYIDEVVGGGDKVEGPEFTVTVHYTGWLTDGTKFDSSVDRGEPAQFPLTGVIPGWTEGVQGMAVGGKRRLIIPSGLAYGPDGRGATIPGGATLIFDIELISIP
jgi:hypothetical protein